MSRYRTWGLFVLLVMVAVGLRVMDANPAVAQTATVAAWRFSADPGLDGMAESWQSLPPVFVSTTPQTVTAPMGGGEVGRVAVRAGHWDDRLFVMLEWADSTPDLGALRVEDFADAAAIQFPAEAGSVVPALCMGQADQAVNIWHWRADMQRDQPDERLQHADLYPSTDDLYFPARAANNPVAVAASPVQNLLAGGFGTLSPSDNQTVTGQGVHQNARWSVVFSRALDSPGSLQPSFSQQPVDTAFAVWNGALEHRNGIKSVSSFIQLRPTDQPPPGEAGQSTSSRIMLVPVAGFILLAGVVVVAIRDRGPSPRP